MRAGISRVVVEVIILVIAVALALLIFSPVGSYIFGALGRTSSVGGSTSISVLSVNLSNDGSQLTLFIKNVGPGSVDGSKALNPGNWSVFIDNVRATIPTTNNPSAFSGTIGSSDPWEPGEVIKLNVNPQNSPAPSPTGSFTIVVYGPQGTQTEYLYRGG